MVIRTGILCVPEYDYSAVEAVVALLRSSIPSLLLLYSTSALSQRYWIEEILRNWCDEEELDLVLTIGATLPAPGPSAAEIVPDATVAVVERLLPGLAEAMRSYAATELALAWLDRSVAGIRGRSLIINLPAEAAPAELFLEAIVDLLPPTFTYLHEDALRASLSQHLAPASSPDEEDTDMPTERVPQSKHLDADEFAAFLRRQK